MIRTYRLALMAAFFLLQGIPFLQGQTLTATALLGQMHQKYYKAPCRCYTFSQNNKHYRNDSLVGTSTWHEAIEFPDKFLVIRGDKGTGVKTIYRNDSVYSYKDNKLVRSGSDSSTLLLFLGGMYYRGLDDVLRRAKAAGYNLDVLSEQSWLGRPVYVIGAQPGNLDASQLWVDREDLKVLRLVERVNEKLNMDFSFVKHKKMCKGSSETEVSVKVNGKLKQEETYFKLRKAKKFPG